MKSLGSLITQFKYLQETVNNTKEKARRGLAFERLLTDLFRSHGLLMTAPFQITGEQIDGAFEYKGWTYLLEVKWQGKKQSTEALYRFQGKPDRRIEGTRGLFISMSGFYKTSVERFERGRKPNTLLWTGEHIEAILKGLATIPELLDLSIRFAAERGELLVSPDILLSSLNDSILVAAQQACAAQVDAEISSLVGKKFIPKLYVERKAQECLDEVIHPERQFQRLLTELKTYQTRSRKTTLLPKTRRTNEQDITFESLMASARSLERTSLPYNSVLRLFLDRLPTELKGRIHVLTARAGTGKTNLLCHLAKLYVKTQPTIFLTGRSGITEKTSIKELIESKLYRFSVNPLPKERLFDRLISIIEKKDSSFLVFLDGINEHRDLELLNAVIVNFLIAVRGKPVIIIASCRDVYWPFFDNSMWPILQWSKLDIVLDLYSPSEFDKAINAYFDHYKIKANLLNEAKDKLAHPLILRFFCEAYGNPSSLNKMQLHEIPDIRLKVLFDDYLNRKLASIRYTAPKRRRTSIEIENFLFSLANRMRVARTREINRDDIPSVTNQTDLDSTESVYVAILGEEIILEEEPEKETGSINVVFTYDEFMEYMIARSMIRSCVAMNKTMLVNLVKECQSNVEDFPSFVGVFEYLGIILREDHNCIIWDIVNLDLTQFGTALCRAIGKLGSDYLEEAEIHILGKMIGSPTKDIRESALSCIRSIVSGKRYQKRWRSRAVELIKQVLTQENDIMIRCSAVKCFELDEIASLSDLAQNIATWWRLGKERIKTKTILLSDDDDEVLKTYGLILEHLGFQHIFLEADPRRTIELVEQVKPDLIITDMHKPKMSGWGMAKAIKLRPKFENMPILLVSALLLPNMNYNDIFCAAISKPTMVKELIATISMTLIGKFEEF